MAALDQDPARSGWWRPLTAVFLQDGGNAGAVWNLVTLVLVAAAAGLWWGDILTVLLFAAGALLPGLVDGAVGTPLRALPGSTGTDAVATSAADPRNFVGSSGATYFLAATLAAAVVLRGSGPLRERVLAGLVPVLGLVAFVVDDDVHGLVTAEGFVIGMVVTAPSSPYGRPRAGPPSTAGAHPDRRAPGGDRERVLSRDARDGRGRERRAIPRDLRTGSAAAPAHSHPDEPTCASTRLGAPVHDETPGRINRPRVSETGLPPTRKHPHCGRFPNLVVLRGSGRQETLRHTQSALPGTPTRTCPSTARQASACGSRIPVDHPSSPRGMNLCADLYREGTGTHGPSHGRATSHLFTKLRPDFLVDCGRRL